MAATGGRGSDRLKGGSGTDFLDGGAGDDYLGSSARKDTMEGGSGDDGCYYSGFSSITSAAATDLSTISVRKHGHG